MKDTPRADPRLRRRGTRRAPRPLIASRFSRHPTPASTRADMSAGLIITLVFLVLILGYAVVEAVRLHRALGTVHAQVQEAAAAAQAGRPLSGDALVEPWGRYRATFLAASGDREMTDARAADYFGEPEVLTGALNLRYWLAIPNVLVGLGILGTFVGLAYGITGFDADTSQQIREGINGLLAGMATAFITSIVGMGTSIAFGVWEKDRFRRVANALRGLVSTLDGRYLITTADRLRFAQQDQVNLLGSLFGYKTEDGPVRPGDALQAIRRESEQQTAALQQFSTDLADGIMLSSMTIEALGVNLGKAFDDAMRATLAPTLDGVRSAVEQLQHEKSASNEAMVEDVVGKLQASLEQMGQQFQHALSGGALTQLESVAASIGEAHGALSALPATVEQLMAEMRSTLAQSNGQIADEVTATSDRLRTETERAVGVFGQTIEALQDRTSDLLDRQGATTESAAKLAAAVGDVLQKTGNASVDLHNATAGLSTTLAELQSLTAAAHQTAGALQESGRSLRETTTAFGEDSRGWLDANRGNLDALRGALDESRRVGADYAEKFGVIEGGLKGVFSELQEGLGEYQSSTRESLNRYLGEFTEQLSTAASALSGSVSALDESLQELVDAVETAGRPRSNGHARP